MSKKIHWKPAWLEKRLESDRNKFFDIVKEFKKMAFEVKEINKGQFRFNDCVDIFPSKKEAVEIKTKNKIKFKGQNSRDFLRKYFNLL